MFGVLITVHFISYIFVCLYVCECLHIWLCTMSWRPEEDVRSPRTVVLSHHVGAEDRTEVLWKSSQHSQPLSSLIG